MSSIRAWRGGSLVLLSIAFAAACRASDDAPAAERVAVEPLVEFTATAYCLDGRTQSGVRTRPGILAADPQVLPVGSVVRIEEPPGHTGIYTVLDTGGAVKGRIVDIYMADCQEAKQFGRQSIQLRVLRHGWDPQQEGAAVSLSEIRVAEAAP